MAGKDWRRFTGRQAYGHDSKAVVAAIQQAKSQEAERIIQGPGTAPNGYADFSYKKRLSQEVTSAGSLP